MTTTLEKTAVTATWNTAKVQEVVATAMSGQCMTAVKVLEKISPEAVKEYQHAVVALRAGAFKAQGVKTPLDLVKHMAETEANLFGSKIHFWGDEKQAHLEYETCGCFNAMQKHNLSEKEMEVAGKRFEQSIELMGKEFGFTGAIKFGKNPGEATAVITFSK